MGMFGLFNYDKAGPGIEKNAPKKRSFIVFFETYFRNFWKFMPISAVHSLLCLPLLTSGLAAAGMTQKKLETGTSCGNYKSFGLCCTFLRRLVLLLCRGNFGYHLLGVNSCPFLCVQRYELLCLDTYDNL